MRDDYSSSAMAQTRGVSLGVVVAVLAFPNAGLSCPCEGLPEPGKETVYAALFQAAVVFSGEVMTIAETPSGGTDVHLRVLRIWKGDKLSDLVISTSSPGECGFVFEKGRSYLVYAKRARPLERPGSSKAEPRGVLGDELHTDRCMRTVLLDDGEMEIKYLGLGRAVGEPAHPDEIYYEDGGFLSLPEAIAVEEEP